VQHWPVELIIAEELAAPVSGVLRAKRLDAVIAAVRHINRAVWRHCHAKRFVELSIALAIRPPRA